MQRFRRWLRTPRGLALTLWAAAFTGYLFLQGIPLDRQPQTLWILLALFASNVGRPWRSQVRILLDWLPFVVFLYLYDYTRGIADTLGRPVHVTEPLAAEKWIFHGTVPSQYLQEHFHRLTYAHWWQHWWDYAAGLVYTSHFLVVWIVAGVLYARSRAEWARWARRILMLSYAGLITYVLYPAAPPWYAARHGLLPNVTEGQFLFQNILDTLGLRFSGALISAGTPEFNAVAALPSLHAAFTAMLTAYVWPRMRWWARTLMVLYTLAMAASLVYGGEHYVFDVLVGYAYVVVVLVVANRWEYWRATRRPVTPQELDLTDEAEPAEARLG
jgi:membrane-associated phospholipid phosphatase